MLLPELKNRKFWSGWRNDPLKRRLVWYRQVRAASSSGRCFSMSLPKEKEEACLFSPSQGQIFLSNSISGMWQALLLFISQTCLIWRRLVQKLFTDDSSPTNTSSYPCGSCHPVTNDCSESLNTVWRVQNFSVCNSCWLKTCSGFLQYLLDWDQVSKEHSLPQVSV